MTEWKEHRSLVTWDVGGSFFTILTMEKTVWIDSCPLERSFFYLTNVFIYQRTRAVNKCLAGEYVRKNLVLRLDDALEAIIVGLIHRREPECNTAKTDLNLHVCTEESWSRTILRLLRIILWACDWDQRVGVHGEGSEV